jgi:hypothetical protein
MPPERAVNRPARRVVRSNFTDQPPRSPEQLRQWLRENFDLEVPMRPLVDGAASPLDYLCHAFLTDFQDPPPPTSDAIVWACRGGGKTFYAAVATALDLIFKPGIEIKILAGSLDQSARMYEHLRRLFERPAFAELVDGRISARRLRLVSGSTAETLAQSHTSVRGARPQKLRCDEVELFDPDIWRAAQLVTRSRRCGSIHVQGAIEALSTMHRPGGLMSRLITEAQTPDPFSPARPSRRLLRWSALDVLEVCPPARPCESCALFPECAGRAKREAEPPPIIGGHISISDAIVLKSRTDQATWESEMLCLRPQRSDSVFPEFDPAMHVAAFEPASDPGAVTWVAGMDFGFRAPTVILWAFLEHDSGMLRIVDERVQAERTIEAHIQTIYDSRPPARVPAWVACDPAGNQRSDQTGHSAVEIMRRATLMMRPARAPLELGLRAIRRRLAPASGPPTICIHPRCRHLIEALQAYHYPDIDPRSLSPVKDGPDHAVDALRYLIITLDHPTPRARVLSYL